MKALGWAPMMLKGCRFKGRFTGNDFAWHALTVAEKMDTTVEELRAALEKAPGIVMEGDSMSGVA